MKNKPTKVLYGSLIVVIVIVVIFIIPIKIPYTIKAYCRIQPAQKWMITTDTNGQLAARTIDYRAGENNSYRVSQFAREGTMSLSFNPRIIAGHTVAVGDTVATIFSSDTEESIADLKAQLSILRASLAAGSRGEKQSVIREYESKLAYTQQQEANQEKILTRANQLLQNKLISQEEYDATETRENLLAAEIDVARSQLESAKTGVKPEEIDLIKAQIDGITEQLAALNKRIESFSLISPISGIISRQYSADTLLIVSDNSSYVALIPFKIREATHLSPNLKVRVYADGTKHNTKGRLMFIDKDVLPLSGEQACVGIAVIEENGVELSPGMFGNCVVYCEPVNLPEYIWAFLRTF